MASSDVQRKLTAIMCADVVGYSRLMGENEKATLRTLTEYRQVFAGYIEKFRGRIVNAPGDSILAEFVSVVDAVEGAAEIQRELAERNAEIVDDRKMLFRIGINLGDVLVKDGDIYGDGVNIAARLESLAEPGGICIARAVYDQVKQKLKIHVEYMGEQQVKNIAEPVRAYQVLTKPGDAAHRVVKAKRIVGRAWRNAALAVAAVVVLVGGGLLGWNYYQQSLSAAALAAFEKEAAFPLPDRPSIAVLAFDNMSGDPEQEYFSDGLSEDIITKLASLSPLFVIARNSSFRYKGKQVDVRQIGRELGVRYVLEGSVRKSGERVRITAQLIDAATGEHLFAKRYDRELKDIFAVQDEIAYQVLAELDIKIGRGEGTSLFLRQTNNFEAFDAYLRCLQLYFEFQKGANFKAEELCLKAIELDPDYALPIALLGWVYMSNYWFGWAPDPNKARLLAEKWTQRAIEADRNQGAGLLLSARFQSEKGNHDQAIAIGRRAMKLRPSDSTAMGSVAWTYLMADQPQHALETIHMGMRLAPYPSAWFHLVAGMANAWTGRHEAAVSEYKKVVAKLKGGSFRTSAMVGLIVGYVNLGEENQAKAAVEKLIKAKPGFTISGYVRTEKVLPYKDFDWLEEDAEILRKMGL
ncbi:MAG: hypothetical protein IIC64_15845, partial [SAR324 cluster bacterium]|nr:hypothetical protein [SAR324 cluster bacterium]